MPDAGGLVADDNKDGISCGFGPGAMLLVLLAYFLSFFHEVYYYLFQLFAPVRVRCKGGLR